MTAVTPEAPRRAMVEATPVPLERMGLSPTNLTVRPDFECALVGPGDEARTTSG
jgi:hypothetical protein